MLTCKASARCRLHYQHFGVPVTYTKLYKCHPLTPRPVIDAKKVLNLAFEAGLLPITGAAFTVALFSWSGE